MAERVERTQDTANRASEPLMDYVLHEFPDPVLLDVVLFDGTRRSLSVRVDLEPWDLLVSYRTLVELRLDVASEVLGEEREAAITLLAALKIPRSPERVRRQMAEELSTIGHVVNLYDPRPVAATELLRIQAGHIGTG